MSLHSIIDVSSGEDAIKQHLSYYHMSFPNFLPNPNHSGRYSQDPNPHCSCITEAYLCVLGNVKESYAESLFCDRSDILTRDKKIMAPPRP